MSLAYLGLRTLGMETSTADALGSSLRDALDADHRVEISAATTASATSCKASLRCYCDAARGAGAARALFGNMAQVDRLFTFELILIDTQDCAIESSTFVAEEHDLPSAQHRIAELLEEVLTPKETISKTAVKEDRDVERTPAIVTTFTAKQIRQLGITRVEEIFRLVPGFEVIDLNFMSRVLHHGISETILILIDGIPLHNPLIAFRGFGADMMISVDLIDRVEFIRGPASVLWGTNALLGVVNFISKNADTEARRVSGVVRVGTLDTSEVSVSVGANQPKIRYFFATTAGRSRGPRSFVEDSLWSSPEENIWGNRGTTQNGWDRYLDVIGKVDVMDTVAVEVSYRDSKDRYQISPMGSLLGPKEQGFWDKSHLLYTLRVRDELPFGLGYRVVLARHQAMFWERFAAYAANADVLPLGEFYRQGNESAPMVNHLGEARLHHDFETSAFSNRVIAGAAYLRQDTPEIYGRVTSGNQVGGLELDLESQTLTTASAFVQEDVTLLDGLISVSGGLRYDRHDPGPGILNKQAGLLLDSTWVSFKALYTEGFRSPTINDRFSTSGIRGDRNLSPERSRSFTTQLTVWVPQVGEIRLGGSLIRVTDLIRINIENPPAGFIGVPENGGEIGIRVAFAELRAQWPSRVEGFVTYSYKAVDETRPQNTGIPIAQHVASAGITWTPLNDLSIFATGGFVSPRVVTALEPGNGAAKFTIPAYYLLDVGATVINVFEHIDLSLSLRNPARLDHWSPLSISGSVSPLVEHRTVSEVLATVRWAL